jgi:A/G-specific adenine glycosylase
MMLQQTQVATVIPYFARWRRRFPDFAALAAASEAEVLSMWQGLGYYSRARNLHRAAQYVVEEFGGTLPPEPAAVASLPGVGRYTAGAVSAFAFDLAVPTVDGNIARVLARLANHAEPIDQSRGMERLWQIAEELLPTRGGRLYTSALMELGALVCTPRKPQCLLCPVNSFCAATDPESLPRKARRIEMKEMDEPCAWILCEERILLEQQTGSRWRGLWKLPRLEEAPAGEPLWVTTYPFTNHRVTLRVFSRDASGPLKQNHEWFERSALSELAMTSPHRRAVTELLCRAEAAC